jgi:short-subunit dehydrogenase
MSGLGNPVALVTGASSGIGLHLAREFARHGHDVAVLAPDPLEVQGVAAEIVREFGVNAFPLAIDLEDDMASDTAARRLADAGLEVQWLVNNAGHGQWGRFWEVPLERHLSIVRLNIEAVLRMTNRFLPSMIARQRGGILNTASVAGFEAGPLLAVYHATKAFVLSWSEALAIELKATGVTVTALCPGPTDTDFFPKADMLDTRAFQQAAVMAPQRVAAEGYKALMAGDPLVVPGAANKALVFSRRFLSETMQARKNEALYQPTDPGDRRRQRGEVETAGSGADAAGTRQA